MKHDVRMFTLDVWNSNICIFNKHFHYLRNIDQLPFFNFFKFFFSFFIFLFIFLFIFCLTLTLNFFHFHIFLFFSSFFCFSNFLFLFLFYFSFFLFLSFHNSLAVSSTSSTAFSPQSSLPCFLLCFHLVHL